MTSMDSLVSIDYSISDDDADRHLLLVRESEQYGRFVDCMPKMTRVWLATAGSCMQVDSK